MTAFSDAEIDELRALVNGRGPIPRVRVMQAMDCDDLRVKCLAYEMVTRAYHRIRPELGTITAGEFLLEYYLICITRKEAQASNEGEDDEIHNRFQAAGELVEFLVRAWEHKPETDELIDKLVDRVTRLYLESDDATRNCIETGILEHALERPHFRPLFRRWEHQSELIEAHQRALEWGLAHERQT